MTDEVATVTRLLGRKPRSRFDVVVRGVAGGPVVIRNEPLLDDGTPMPTRYWLVDAELSAKVRRLEPVGGVRREFRQVMNIGGVERVRMTATSAARDAANREDFFKGAEEIIGVRPELLTGDAEARLSFLGAASQLDQGDGPFLVVDIGGGS